MKWLFLVGLLVFGFSEISILPEGKVQPINWDIEITIWYGEVQQFGHLGRSQRWLNILGNVSNADAVREVQYFLNGQRSRSLSLGTDLHRLAMPGDFNVELSWDEVKEGMNHLMIQAITLENRKIVKSIQFDVHEHVKWALPYAVDFSAVKNLQEVVQIVDGQWELVEEGVRTKQKYYDRVLTMGDTSWTNYESQVLLTIHDWTPSEPGPPTYNVSHFGVAMRWRGHHADSRQPSRKWFPLGAQGEFLLNAHPDSSHWRILFDGRTKEKPQVYASNRNRFQKGDKIKIKTQAMTIQDGRTRYRFKQWLAKLPEPAFWDVEGFEMYDYSSGALCLVPHNSDVTIHKISIIPLIKDDEDK